MSDPQTSVPQKVVLGGRVFGHGVEVPPECADKDFWKMVIRYQFIYSLLGLVAAFLCVAAGLLLFVMGITGQGTWSADFFGIHINDAAPGMVLFVIGFALAQITQFSVKLVPGTSAGGNGSTGK